MDRDDIKRFAGWDWKAIGYMTSIVSVFFLGAVAAYKADAPPWYYAALAIGVITSVAGMGFRYLAHIQQKRDMDRTRRKAERR